jgi:SAM-dependent methyltransferase
MDAAVKPYQLDNTHPRSSDHHRALTELYNPYSCRRASELLELDGAHCLEVGYGGGSFALWLADAVGLDGSVLATDIVPREMPEHPRMTVLRHDIVHEPIPGTYDFVHARLVTSHLSNRREVLRKLIAALNPGGVILLEEWYGPSAGNLVVHAPSPEAADLVDQVSRAQQQVIRGEHGGLEWSRQVHGAMMDEGLVDVNSEVHGRAWVGGGPGGLMMQSTMAQMRPKLLGVGLTEEHLDRVHALLDDPQLVMIGNMICSTSGRRPA